MCSSPKSLLPVDASRKGEAGRNVEKHDDPTSKADDDQAPGHRGQDGTFASQVMAGDGVADQEISVEDDPHW